MKPRRALAGVWTVLLGAASPLPAEEAIIEYFTSNFLPQSVTVELGDVVTWLRVSGEHTVTSGSGPEDPHAGELFDEVLDAGNSSFSFPIEDPAREGYSFFCRRHHRPERVGFVKVSSGEVAVRVGVVDNVFLPDESFIFENDSIRWELEPNEGYHTVTSGLGAAEPGAGMLFDEELSNEVGFSQVFVHPFPDPGVYPYFCRPHEHLGMTGTIYVQSHFVRGDATGDRVVDISDAVLTLNHLFLGSPRRPCDDALDANDDGVLDISDPLFSLGFLFLGETPIPAPFPRAGADRTEDELRCWP